MRAHDKASDSEWGLNAVNLNTPLRLNTAAALVFPDGSMTGSGLRREAARGRLVIERIAGKDFTTLGNIDKMRKLCRVEAKVPISGSGKRNESATENLSADQAGLSSTMVGTSPQDALRAKIKKAQSEN